MIFASKSKFHLPNHNSSPFLSLTSILKWVSTKPQFFQPQNPFHSLISLINSSTDQTDLINHLLSALKSSTTHFSLPQGQQIHCLALKSGFESNNFVHNTLINMYAKFGVLGDAMSLFSLSSKSDPVPYNIMIAANVKAGKFDDARKLFDEMPERSCVSYTSMIMGFSKSNCWIEAVELFKEMRNLGIAPNEVTMSTLISVFPHVCGIWGCRMLHGQVIKMMFIELVLISTNLLRFYCVCSSLIEARALFDEMRERNIVSWNVMLNGYSKARYLELAKEIFDQIPSKDVVSWCTIIDGYVQADKLSEALMMYKSMVSFGLQPNDFVMVDLISACGKSAAVSEGQQLHNTAVKTGLDCFDFIQAAILHFYGSCGRITEACLQFSLSSKYNVALWNALMAGYVRFGEIEKARKLFDEMPERDVFSWSTLISGYTQNEQPKLALELFHNMVASGIQPSEVTMVSVFSAIAALGILKEGISAHEFVVNNAITMTDNLSAAIIDMYAKCGSIETALEFFYKIKDKASDVSPWNAIICGLALHGFPDLCLKLFSDLEKRKIELNSITFVGVLSACCHAGLVAVGERHFRGMKSRHNVEPDIKHFGCMVDLLGRAGRLKEAEEMIRTMPVKPDVVIWGTLLAACRTHGDVDVGERAAEELARLEPNHGGSRVLLSNIYADAGKWEDSWLVRKAMQSCGMKNLPGYSGVT